MTFALLGQVASPSYSGTLSGPPASLTYQMPVAAPVGSLLTVFGSIAGGTVGSVSDTKGNAWVTRLDGSTSFGMFLVDCRVTNALTTSDTVTIPKAAGNAWGATLAAWSDAHASAYFDKATAAQWSQTSALPGVAAAATTNNELVLGIFGFFSQTSGTPSISTPGSGYANMIGAYENNTLDGVCGGFDWEYKVAGAQATEQPGATLSLSMFNSFGITALYRPSAYVLPPPLAMVV